MKLLVLVLSLIAGHAHAVDYEHKVGQFTIPTFGTFGSKIYYNCDSVETKTKKLLKALGAKVQSVKCTGGLDTFGGIHLPARVTALYSTLNSKLAGDIKTKMKTVNFKSRKDCHLYSQIFKRVKKKFEISNIKVRSCSSLDDRTYIKARVIIAQ